ncbi:MAG: 50S ribosomal protein L17 [Chloroflexi bacterium]|nr:50S ribosomal protein L17 [Chloroflexota bacterium]MBM3154328.1 50S ribosomal protein L17 [Chloroflexota bacterium]MBM3174462.1 50S ribosomal protein L17 [Chloroflexota bacterium]MBM4449588.1 50S ribosomal protein L17 [Chloroflexota bacterium]
MRHKLAGRKLSRPTAQRWALYRNLVTDLFKYEKIVTTEAKAKEVRSLAEKMITLGKEGSLASRRRALAFVYNKKIVDKLFDELATRYAERAGGYTRIMKLGPRLGDGAPMAQLEMVR